MTNSLIDLDIPRSRQAVRLVNWLAGIALLIAVVSFAVGLWGAIISETSRYEGAFIFLVSGNTAYASFVLRHTALSIQTTIDVWNDHV